MTIVCACCLTPDDYRRLGNNVAPAVRRHRRPQAAHPAAASRSVTNRVVRPVRPTILKFNTLGASPAA